ncbi:FAD-dependent oxidoreductase [Aureimonas sp. Leaf454]|uniref:NAD(P)/FAD-dependent oxidoreductase n=1 Tax=Aureimonas sp. Leaf454 TaxID=1736381 RepID=UPI0006FD4903|nr:FAD-binding oxidoreductase [Aureimonas sp. Leaf454]KQT43022.1 FAD-dependent oxidoreductase [Aureimonas sp. Leaf454]
MFGDARSHGLWERTAPPAPDTARLSGESVADVVIVGGGYTGCSAALHLAQGGAKVVLLEGKAIGFGGSGRNVGLVNAGLWVMPDAVPDLLGAVHGERLLSLLGAAPRAVFDLVERHAIDCELVTTGTLHLAVGEAGTREIADRAAQWQKRGADVELIDAAATCAKVGSPLYAGALLDRRAGTIQPLAYVRGLARAAIAAGAFLHTESPVTSYARDGDGWRVETPGGSVRARWIVVATNAYTSGASGAPWPAIREEIVHLPYFNIATTPLSSNLARSILPERQGAWDTKTILSSFRFDARGRLVVGSVGALRGSGSAIHRSWARRSLQRIFPQLSAIAFEAEWYGSIGMTTDAVPRFHRLAHNVVSFSGYNGRGIAPGTVFGQVLARHILGEMTEDELPLPVTPPEAQGFRPIREAWYEAGAQIAHLSARV